MLDIEQNHLSAIECGNYLVTTKMLFKLEAVLGGSPNYYLKGELDAPEDKFTNAMKSLPVEVQHAISSTVFALAEEYATHKV